MCSKKIKNEKVDCRCFDVVFRCFSLISTKKLKNEISKVRFNTGQNPLRDKYGTNTGQAYNACSERVLYVPKMSLSRMSRIELKIIKCRF